MLQLLNKVKGRSVGQITIAIVRRLKRSSVIRAERRKAKEVDYLNLSTLLPPEKFPVEKRLNEWSTNPEIGLNGFLEKRVTQLLKNENSREELLLVAEKAIIGTISVYGKQFNLGNHIEWNRDLTGEGVWPQKFIRYYRFPDTSGKRGDYRHVWELGRQQHLTLLGLAWKITQEEKYATAIIEHISSWLEQNPVYYSMQWASAMEVALRMISWITAITLIANSVTLNGKQLRFIIAGLIQHQRFLLDHLSIDIDHGEGPVKLRNNHTIVELCGAIIAGYFLQDVTGEKAQRGTKELYALLSDEIEFQTYPDGMNVEQSSSYQRFTLESLLVTHLCTKDEEPRNRLKEQCECHLSALVSLSVTSDRFVLVGDEDNGHAILTRTAPQPDDMTEVLDMFSHIGKVPSIPTSTTLLKDSGHWCWRGHIINTPATVYFRSGRMDFPEIPGYGPHAQCDLLSFSLYVNGQPVCVDSGTYTYHDLQQRKKLRSGQSHNIFGFAGYEQMQILGPFNAKGYAYACISDASDSSVTGNLSLHREGVDIKMQRRITINVAEGLIQIRDRINEGPQECIEWYLNLHGDVTGSPDELMRVRSDAYMQVLGFNIDESVEGAYSSEYGVIEKSNCYITRKMWDGTSPLEHSWSIKLVRDNHQI